jgi:aminopeptidase
MVSVSPTSRTWPTYRQARSTSSRLEARESSSCSTVTGELGELGFGTQELPVSGRDIQDEKILGTLHVATGRSDHLGGNLTPDKFAKANNATHDDILFSPSKTPDITVTQARMHRDGETIVVLENYQPAAHLRDALNQPDN